MGASTSWPPPAPSRGSRLRLDRLEAFEARIEEADAKGGPAEELLKVFRDLEQGRRPSPRYLEGLATRVGTASAQGTASRFKAAERSKMHARAAKAVLALAT